MRNKMTGIWLSIAGLAALCWTAGAAQAGTALRLDFQGLEPLGSEAVYEGWLIIDGMPHSTGVFRVDGSGNAIPSTFAVSKSDAAKASEFVLTIEPADDKDPAPSATHVLAGSFAQDAAPLSVDHPAALGTDFAQASGDYILQTPSSADVAEDYNRGIWWLQPTQSGPVAGLELPMLPDGWIYEGWVAGPDGPISTGRFHMPQGEDMDGAGPAAGANGFPPFPGQDFIDPARELPGTHVAVISVEPVPDNSPAPFALKPLIDMDIEDVGPGVPQQMSNMAGQNPSGSASFFTAVRMALRLKGLEDLGDEFVYEGWLIDSNGPVSTGRFTVGANGYPDRRIFLVERKVARFASKFVLTIEPEAGDDDAPADTHYLAGDFNKFKATLSVDHSAALGTDFSSASGAYILETPSTADVEDDYGQGIWWLTMTGDGPAPGLSLPELPLGWVYEGWIVGSGGAVSTGRFTSGLGADEDGAGATAGQDGTPPFPGQDFIAPPMSLTAGVTAVITVEPEPDNSPAPFTLKPLASPTIEDVGPGSPQTMMVKAIAAPYGKVSYLPY